MSSRTFLFLQGHPSRFGKDLAVALEQQGHRTLRINFCVGDVLFWLGRPAISYRGAFSKWPEYLATLIQREQITDIIYYGDCRPYHRVARQVAERFGVNAYAYEFGYLRPDWLTLERGGLSSASHFPIDPVKIKEIGENFPAPDLTPRYSYSIAVELMHEIVNQFSSYFFHFVFPNYEADRYYNPITEYLSGIPKQLEASRHARHADAVISRTLASGNQYFVVPLQLQCDYQLRSNARYAHQSEAITEVISSFSNYSSSDARLIFKCHPLDNGAEHWDRHISIAGKACGISHRIDYIDGGNLNKLIKGSSGVVTINSTVGLQALIMDKPVKVLGTAVFDIEGATHRHSLNTFWRYPTKPDADLVKALVRALAGTTQVRGSFFDPKGRAAAVTTFADRLIRNEVNGSGAFVVLPPRIPKQVTGIP